MPKSSRLFLTLKRARRRIFSHRRAVRAAVLTLIAVLLFLSLTAAIKPLIGLSANLFLGPGNILSLLLPKSFELKSSAGRTNILLLGIGGQAHDGPYLTDTMIVASLPASPSAISLISIPRDIYLDSLQDKINSAYAQGFENDASHSGAGLTMAKAAVSEVTGLPIHYGLRVDFSAFQQMIDLLGGVDINVEHPLDDYFYPIEGKEDDTCGFDPATIQSRLAAAPILSPDFAFPCRFEHLHFDAGPTHMNGETALKYVRSRHAEGDEGTDFARSRRQELLITAVKDKIFSTQTLLNPSKIAQIYNLFKSHLDTDLDPKDTGDLLKLALRYNHVPLKRIVLDQNLFDNPPIDARGWILLPRDNSWDEIHNFIKTQL